MVGFKVWNLWCASYDRAITLLQPTFEVIICDSWLILVFNAGTFLSFESIWIFNVSVGFTILISFALIKGVCVSWAFWYLSKGKLLDLFTFFLLRWKQLRTILKHICNRLQIWRSHCSKRVLVRRCGVIVVIACWCVHFRWIVMRPWLWAHIFRLTLPFRRLAWQLLDWFQVFYCGRN